MQMQDFLNRLGLTTQAVTGAEDVSSFLQQSVDGIAISSAQVGSGMIFAAIKGTKADGADFIPQAIEQGAIAVLSDRPIQAKVPVIRVSDVRQAVALAADMFYPTPNMKKIAVTGTNGKTSTTYFVRQILNTVGRVAANIGTVGIESPVLTRSGSMTTPDSLVLHQILKELADKGVQYTAMEASSHGLDQHRLDGLSFIATGFTNLTRDHLDYHGSMENYLKAKLKLFTQRTQTDGVVVINADVPEFEVIAEAVRQKGIRICSYGQNGSDLKLISRKPTEKGQDIVFEAQGKQYAVSLSIFGDFQVMNILCAIGLCLGAGLSLEEIIAVLPELEAPAGRMEVVATVNGASVFVDYAHTPDALERVLISLRPHTDKRLVCLFGCGGNRDTGKRPQMGEIADRLADVVFITDDNPRFEDPATIRAAIKAACPKGIEIDGREKAIYQALKTVSEGDILVLCGKGHETGQTIGSTGYLMNDKTEVLSLGASFQKEVVWRWDELKMALSADVADTVFATGISIDTRTTEAGDLFIAIKGENTDGHRFVSMAVEKGACACVVDHLIDKIPAWKQIVVTDTTEALESLARFARMRSSATFIGITGSSGKTTTKEMLKTVLSKQGKTYATAGNFNNQIGVPLMLARMPLQTEYAVIEMGMNHFGEMAFLSDLVRPNYSLITMVGAAHREYFKDDSEIAMAKAEIFTFADKNGRTVLNKESPFYDYLCEQAAQNGIRKILSFGQKSGADFEMTDCHVEAGKTVVDMRWGGQSYTYEIGFTGRHFALNSLAVLAMVEAVGGSVEQAMTDLAQTHAVAGRGLAEKVVLSDGRLITLIDDAYNANPASMTASIQSLGAYKENRRIAVLGDMLELGSESEVFHTSLESVLQANQIHKLFAIGPMMQKLFAQVPTQMQGAEALSVDEIMKPLWNELKTGDVVLVKASNGTGLKKIIAALKGEK